MAGRIPLELCGIWDSTMTWAGCCVNSSVSTHMVEAMKSLYRAIVSNNEDQGSDSSFEIGNVVYETLLVLQKPILKLGKAA